MEWVIPAVALLLLILGVFTRSRLTTLQQEAAQGWSDADALLRLRHDLVPRLVEVLKGRIARDRKALDGVMAARGRAVAARTPADIGKAEAALGAAIGKIFEVVEENAGLKDDPDLRRLRSELSGIESRIAKSARAYNDAAREYNKARIGFPGGFLAYVIRLDVLEYYTLVEAKPQSAQTVPARL
jgi:LemA protein